MTLRQFGRWLVVTALLTALYGFATYPQLFFTPGARRALLALNGPVESFACMYGIRGANTVGIVAVRPAPVTKQRGNLWAASVVCASTPFLLGLAHNHPGGINCWYRFPGTDYPTADLETLRRGTYSLGLIICGDTFAWELN